MGGNTYSNNDYQRMNRFNGGCQIGYQRRGHECPLLGPGGQYGIVQDGNQGWPPMAAGNGRDIPSPNYVHAWTQDNAWENTKKAAPVGARNGKTWRGAKKEATNQYMRHSTGTREAERQENTKEARGHRSHLRDLEGVAPRWYRGSSLIR